MTLAKISKEASMYGRLKYCTREIHTIEKVRNIILKHVMSSIGGVLAQKWKPDKDFFVSRLQT